MKHFLTKLTILTAALSLGLGPAASPQASIASLIQFKKNQDAGIAQAIADSQAKAQAARKGKLKGGKDQPEPPSHAKPSVIHLASHVTSVGVDNRRRSNVR